MAYSLTELRKALMALKKEKKFSGTPSKMKKSEIMDALKSLNFQFNSLPSYGKNVKPQQKRKTPIGPTMPVVYSKKTGTYVKTAPTTAPIPTPAMAKVVIPKSSQTLINRLQKLKSTVASNESAVAKMEASTPATRRRGRPPKGL
jgi:hypothetical protein